MLTNLNTTGLNTNGRRTTVKPTPVIENNGNTLGTMFSDKYASILNWYPRLI